MRNQVKVILFDIGGVLIDFIGLSEIAKLTPHDLTPEDVRSRWVFSPSNRAFERGELSPHDFASQFTEEWGLSLGPEEFIQTFISWIPGPLHGMEELLVKLKPGFQLACLSNTNELHWDALLNDFGLSDLLHRHYASHLIGSIKPDTGIFQFVCNDLDVTPEQVIFFDDGKENVKGAQDAGLHAFLVNGPAQVREKLLELGLIL